MLVVDVGGGTSDFSLLELRTAGPGASPKIKRLAVSDHILLGGDNIDLALAHLLEPRLGQGAGAGRGQALGRPVGPPRRPLPRPQGEGAGGRRRAGRSLPRRDSEPRLEPGRGRAIGASEPGGDRSGAAGGLLSGVRGSGTAASRAGRPEGMGPALRRRQRRHPASRCLSRRPAQRRRAAVQRRLALSAIVAQPASRADRQVARRRRAAGPGECPAGSGGGARRRPLRQAAASQGRADRGRRRAGHLPGSPSDLVGGHAGAGTALAGLHPAARRLAGGHLRGGRPWSRTAHQRAGSLPDLVLDPPRPQQGRRRARLAGRRVPAAAAARNHRQDRRRSIARLGRPNGAGAAVGQGDRAGPAPGVLPQSRSRDPPVLAPRLQPPPARAGQARGGTAAGYSRRAARREPAGRRAEGCSQPLTSALRACSTSRSASATS